MSRKEKKFKKSKILKTNKLPFLLQEKNIAFAIAINALAIFFLSFESLIKYHQFFEWIDILVTCILLAEMAFKLKLEGFRDYFSSANNQFDFIIVMMALPSILVSFHQLPDLSVFVVLRLLRVFKFFRFLRMVPNLRGLLKGIKRAFKASLLILVGFFIYTFVVALITTRLYQNIAPEFFGNALNGFYHIFRIFTIEGWYEIPDAIANQQTETMGFLTRFYFMFIVASGGLLGLSIINAIFVDEMMSDNNDELEKKIEKLSAKIDELITQNHKKNLP